MTVVIPSNTNPCFLLSLAVALKQLIIEDWEIIFASFLFIVLFSFVPTRQIIS